MITTLIARLQQGHRTIAYPDSPPAIPDRLRGMPVIDHGKCREDCSKCIEVCPNDAIFFSGNQKDCREELRDASGIPPDRGILTLDLGRCLFCGECTRSCHEGAIRFTSDHRLAVRTREDLKLGKNGIKLASQLNSEMMRLFGRSLKLRQVSAGGCNGCEVDINVLTTVVFDLNRFGINIVASPRHADGLIVTGPITGNMKLATMKTFAAVPPPKLVIAVGACAISGGPFRDHPEQHNGAGGFLPVDLYIPGCPPHPITILDGMLRLLGRLKE